jgi:DNA-binding SARP family transcriptional activator
MVSIAQFHILGPLEVWITGRRARVTAPRELTTLAALLLERGKVVSVERLVDAVWADRPPTGPANQIAICISSLRHKLTEVGAPERLIATVPPGYLLRRQDCELDADQVDAYVSEARELITAGRLEDAAGQLRAALDLWRGPVLSGIGSRSLQPEIVRWEERRLAIAEQYAQLELDLGSSFELIGDLSATVADQTLRERPRAQLMVALYRAGRTAEALDVYADFHRTLRKELGLEPGKELRALHKAVLNGTLGNGPSSRTAERAQAGPEQARADARAGLPSPPRHVFQPRAPGPTRSAPAMLPTDIADFTGRAEEIEALSAALAGPQGTAVPVAVVCGAGGTGKTALAVHVAHRLADDFPDGQLYADLHGVRLDAASCGEVLRRFLRALGVDDSQIPEAAVEQRAEMYRSLMAGMRVLVVLDNVISETHLETLLPGSPTCGVLVTSRTRLTGLAGASLLELDVFRLDQAVALLRAMLGEERVGAEPGVAAELAGYCGCLPLAVRIVGARLAAKSHWTLADLAARLVGERGRLDELAHGVLAVRADLTQTYQELAPLSRRLLCRLGLLDAPDFAIWSGVTLLETDELRAAAAFEALVDAHLLEAAVAGPADEVRYRFPALVRLYARERAGWDEPTAEQQAAVTRVTGAWFGLARRARVAMTGGDHRLVRAAGVAPRPRRAPAYAQRLVADPLVWYRAERPHLATAIRQATRHGLDGLSRDLAITATTLFRATGNYLGWQRTNELAGRRAPLRRPRR